jgi:hypothetical protein
VTKIRRRSDRAGGAGDLGAIFTFRVLPRRDSLIQRQGKFLQGSVIWHAVFSPVAFSEGRYGLSLPSYTLRTQL